MSYKVFNSLLSKDSKKHTIVLIHGFVSSQKYWKRLIPYLQDAGYRVVTIDLLGFGSSRDVPTSQYTHESHLEHIQKCLYDADVQPPFVLVGHSMGGLLSAEYAAKHPRNICNLILLHPPMYKNINQARQTLYSTGALYKFLLTSRFRKIGWGLLKFMPTGVENHRAKGREGSLQNVILREGNLYLLTNSHVKTLLIIGEKDRQIYLENLDGINVSKNVTVDVIETGHHSAKSDPEMVSEKILAFIK